MEKSESIKNIAMALIKFNGLVGTIQKDTTNPFFKSKYASLPDILKSIQEPLIKSGLTLNQFPDGDYGLTTILIHAESGEYMLSTYTMNPVKNDPQGRGSSITYQRRYAVGAILSLNIDEDDDANAASNNKPEKSAVVESPSLPTLTPDTPQWLKAIDFLKQGVSLEDIKASCTLTPENETELINQSKI